MDYKDTDVSKYTLDDIRYHTYMWNYKLARAIAEHYNVELCSRCNGDGYITNITSICGCFGMDKEIPCLENDDHNIEEDIDCPYCNGKGYISNV